VVSDRRSSREYRNNFPRQPFDMTSKEPVMPEMQETETEAQRRSLALEGAMLLMIDGLAARGTISVDEAEDMLRILSTSSDGSALRANNSLRVVNQLKRLRRGDGSAAPGA
jgi:hypothetical protein